MELEARLIDDMLDLTRIVRGKLILNRRIVDGREVVDHAIETCRAEIMDMLAPAGKVYQAGTLSGNPLATAAGSRAPLAHTANQVFMDLVSELKDQGLGNKVIADMFRMYDLGIRGFMLVDEGLMWLVHRMQQENNFPKDVAIKISVWTSHGNPAGAKVLEELGAGSPKWA